MKKIVRGNDFTLRIPVKKMVDGELVDFALPACTDIVVNLISLSRRYPLEYTIDAEHDNVLLASVKSSALPLCKMALEVRGKIFDYQWRSNEYEQIQFVDNNASGDTEFSNVDEGEQSVEVDTAIVILAPSAELSLLISQAEQTIAQAEQTIAQAEQTAEECKEAVKPLETAQNLTQEEYDALEVKDENVYYIITED